MEHGHTMREQDVSSMHTYIKYDHTTQHVHTTTSQYIHSAHPTHVSHPSYMPRAHAHEMTHDLRSDDEEECLGIDDDFDTCMCMA